MLFNKSVYDKVFEKWQKRQQQLIDSYGKEFYFKSKAQIETSDTDQKKVHAVGNGINLKISAISRKDIYNPYKYSVKNPEEKKIYGEKIIYLISIDTGKDVRFYESKLFDTFEEADGDRNKLLNKLPKPTEAEIREQIENASGYELIRMAHTKKIKNIQSFQEYKDIIELLNKALAKDISDYTKAETHKWLGEIYLLDNNAEKAIFNYEKAISYSPKIGLKKKLDSLKKNQQ